MFGPLSDESSKALSNYTLERARVVPNSSVAREALKAPIFSTLPCAACAALICGRLAIGGFEMMLVVFGQPAWVDENRRSARGGGRGRK